MTRMARWTTLAGLAFGALAGCGGGGPTGDWRQVVGRPIGDAVAVRPAAPLQVPAFLELPPPGGASRAGEALVVRR